MPADLTPREAAIFLVALTEDGNWPIRMAVTAHERAQIIQKLRAILRAAGRRAAA